MLKSSRNEPWAPFSGVLAALVAARPTLKGSNFVNFDFQALQKKKSSPWTSARRIVSATQNRDQSN